MKKIIYSTAIFICLNAPLNAQWINSIQHQPNNPTTADTLTFFVALSFPSGTCDEHAQGYNLNGNKIEAFALHCLGMLTYICNHTDTFKINPLPAGSYTFSFQLDAGMLPSPCAPGIIPSMIDSITFVVSPATGISEMNAAEITINLEDDDLVVVMNQNEKGMLSVYDMNGKLIMNSEIKSGYLRMNISGLRKGQYVYSISSGNKTLKEGSFTKP